MENEEKINYIKYLIEKDLEGYCCCNDIFGTPCDDCYECWKRIVKKVLDN